MIWSRTVDNSNQYLMTFIIFTCNFDRAMGEDMMRCSTQRESILEIIKDTYGHPSVDWIYAQARLINL